MDLPAKTEYTLIYDTKDAHEIWRGALHMFFAPRLVFGVLAIYAAAVCMVASTIPLPFIFVFTALMVAGTLAQLAVNLNCAILHTISILAMCKLKMKCTTLIDETGINDRFGIVSFNYKWHKIWDVEMRDEGIFFLALVNGIQIPLSAFADKNEAFNAFALAKHYHSEAKKKKPSGNITEGYMPDPDHLIKSLQADEEAKWQEIERRHKELKGEQR